MLLSLIKKLTITIATCVILLPGCTLNIGGKTKNSSASPETTESQSASGDVNSSWIQLGIRENSYSQSELSEVSGVYYGVMSTPDLRLFEFRNSEWIETPASVVAELPPPEDDYQVTIQSELITADTTSDFVLRLDPAPWDVLDSENQGRSIGLVLSVDDGSWKSLSFWDPYDPSTIYNSVEYIEFANGALIGQWYGSCGRPCGLLSYTWNSSSSRLEGVEANERQASSIRGVYCTAFSFVDGLPLKKCQEGFSIQYLQTFLNELGYELEVDGYFGSDTTFAVQHFQKANNLRATGIVELDTWRILTMGKALPGRDLNGDGVVAPEELSGN